jgi:hypothetical protein
MGGSRSGFRFAFPKTIRPRSKIVVFCSALVVLSARSFGATVLDTIVDSYNYVIATQDAGDGRYTFTGASKALEAARQIRDMGANIIKCPWGSTGCAQMSGADFDSILHMPFYYYYFWYRTPYGTTNPESYFTTPALNYWVRGITAAEIQMEHDSTYEFCKRLLTECNNTGKKFYLGHWEGDWIMLTDYTTNKDASQTSIDAMTSWLKARQAGCDSAKRTVAHTNVDVFCYTEVNKVLDAQNSGYKRLVNAVLPNVPIDYVSFSSYDVQWNDSNTVKNAYNYIKSKLPAKAGITGERIFFLEFSFNARDNGNYAMAPHELANRNCALNFFPTNSPVMLYWEMYNNEPQCDKANGTDIGYWLIDNYNVKWSLYYTLKAYYKAAKAYVRQFYTANSRVPTYAEFKTWAVSFLKTVKSGTVEPGIIYKLTSRVSSKVLAVKDSSVAANYAVVQSAFNNGADQMWRIEETAAGSGLYKLTAVHSGLCLTEAATTNGTAATQATWANTSSQKWTIDYQWSLGGYFRLINNASGRVLEVSGSSAAEGATIQQYDWSSANNQQWKVEALSDTPQAATGLSLPAAAQTSARPIGFTCVSSSGTLAMTFNLNEQTVITLSMYDAGGKQCAVLINRSQRAAGTKSFGYSLKSLKLSRGVYIASLRAGNGIREQRLVPVF